MGDRIFPLVDRRTPLLDRLQKGGSSKFTDQAAKELIAVRESDEQDAVELMETFSDNFKESLADEMGVDKEDINPELVEEFMSFVFFEGAFSIPNSEDEEDTSDEEETEDMGDDNPLKGLQDDEPE